MAILPPCMTPALDDADEGKFVRHGDLTIGRAERITEGTVHVDLEDSVPENVMAVFEWDDHDGETYPLPTEAVDRVSEDTIHLHESAEDHEPTR